MATILSHFTPKSKDVCAEGYLDTTEQHPLR